VAQAEVVLHSDASAESIEAYGWYAEHDPRDDDRDEQEVESAFERIARVR
jgi:hypothetical protein